MPHKIARDKLDGTIRQRFWIRGAESAASLQKALEGAHKGGQTLDARSFAGILTVMGLSVNRTVTTASRDKDV